MRSRHDLPLPPSWQCCEIPPLPQEKSDALTGESSILVKHQTLDRRNLLFPSFRQVLYGAAYASERVIEVACVRHAEFFGEIRISDRLAGLGLADEKRKSEPCSLLVKRITSNRFRNPGGVACHNVPPLKAFRPGVARVPAPEIEHLALDGVRRHLETTGIPGAA